MPATGPGAGAVAVDPVAGHHHGTGTAEGDDGAAGPGGDERTGGGERPVDEVGGVLVDRLRVVVAAGEDRLGLGEVGADEVRPGGERARERLAGRVDDRDRAVLVGQRGELAVGVGGGAGGQRAGADEHVVVRERRGHGSAVGVPGGGVELRAGLVDDGDPAGVLHQDGGGPGPALHGHPDEVGALLLEQAAQLLAVHGRHEPGDDGAVAVAAQHPRDVDALAARGHLGLAAAVDRPGGEQGQPEGAVEAQVRGRHEHGSTSSPSSGV